MAKAGFTLRARLDLVQIWNFLAERSYPAADRTVEELLRRCEMLAESPGMGSSRPEIRPDMRCFTSGSYVIYFRPRGDSIHVIRVVHGSRDWSSLEWDDA